MAGTASSFNSYSNPARASGKVCSEATRLKPLSPSSDADTRVDSPKTQTPPTRKRQLLIVVAIVLLLAGGLVYRWRIALWEQTMLFLQSDFRVVTIDPQAKNMTLTRPGETLLVDCEDVCSLFKLGKKYSLMDRGGVLEFKRGRNKLELPILEQHLEFEKMPGGRG